MSRVKYGAFAAGLVVSASAFADVMTSSDPDIQLAQMTPTYTQVGERPRGIIRPKAEAKIAAELVARIDKIPFSEGDRFRQGDVLVRFDCRRYEAELNAVKAELRGAKRTLESNLELRRHKAIGTDELEISRAKVDEVAARVAALQVRTGQCEIRAPYSGRVVELFSNEHEMPTANSPLIKVVDDEKLEIDLIVPSTWLVWLKVGTKFSFSVDETQRTYKATVNSIAAVVDPVSQTVDLKASFQMSPRGVLPGMSGTAFFDVPNGT